MNETLFTTLCYKYCQDKGFEITKVGNTGSCFYCDYRSPLSKTAVASILYSIKDSGTEAEDEDCFFFTDRKDTFVSCIRSADYKEDCYSFLESLIEGFKEFLDDCGRKMNMKFNFFNDFYFFF